MSTVVEMWKAGERNTGAIAKACGISTRTVLRHLDAANIDRPRRLMPVEHPAYWQAYRLLSEGMPATWVAETCDMPYNTALFIRQGIPGWREFNHEWTVMWQAIRKNEELLKLHYEIAPPSLKQRIASHELAA